MADPNLKSRIFADLMPPEQAKPMAFGVGVGIGIGIGFREKKPTASPLEPGLWFLVSGFGYRDSGFRFQVQGSRFGVQG